MKKILIIVLTAIVGTVGFFSYRFYQRETQNANPLSLIPKDAIYIVQADDPIANWRDFSQSPFWTFLKNHSELAEITADADYLDTLIDDNSRIFKQFGQRDFYNTILDLYDKSYRDHLYMAQVKNFLVCTYTRKLIENAIDQHSDETYEPSDKFTEVQNRIDNDGLARFYLNYEYLDNYIKLYADLNPASLAALSSSFCFTGLDMELDDEELSLNGYTSLPDSVDQYSKLLQKYGNAEFEFDDVISARTAYLQA